MADASNKNHSRRKFLSLGILAGAGLITTNVSAQSLNENEETVKMLTQDGKLVEVKKSLLAKASTKKPGSKKDVLGWIHSEKS